MPFWKKGEDPWDWEPERPSGSPEAEDGRSGLLDGLRDDASGLMDELRDWNQERREKRGQEDAPLSPMACPWCGGEMTLGYLDANQGSIWWTPERPGIKSTLIGPTPKSALRVDNEGTFITYKTAWYCTACEKIVIDAAGMRGLYEDPFGTFGVPEDAPQADPRAAGGAPVPQPGPSEPEDAP